MLQFKSIGTISGLLRQICLVPVKFGLFYCNTGYHLCGKMAQVSFDMKNTRAGEGRFGAVIVVLLVQID